MYNVFEQYGSGSKSVIVNKRIQFLSQDFTHNGIARCDLRFKDKILYITLYGKICNLSM